MEKEWIRIPCKLVAMDTTSTCGKSSRLLNHHYFWKINLDSICNTHFIAVQFNTVGEYPRYYCYPQEQCQNSRADPLYSYCC